MELLKILLEFLAALVWPAVAMFILWRFHAPLANLIPQIKSAKLPGGIDLDFGERLIEAKVTADDITANPEPRTDKPQAPATEDANRLLLERGLRPSPSGLNFDIYRTYAKQDPVLALAGLRTEIEAMIRNLSEIFEVDLGDSNSAMEMLKKLHDAGAIRTRQYRLGLDVIKLCGAAIHGAAVNREQAETIIDVATVLSGEYLEWVG